MNSVDDLLKQARGSGYGAGSKSEGETGPRSFPLTPEEVEALGDKSDCVKVYGSHDGKNYSIDRVEPDIVQNPAQMSPS